MIKKQTEGHGRLDIAPIVYRIFKSTGFFFLEVRINLPFKYYIDFELLNYSPAIEFKKYETEK